MLKRLFAIGMTAAMLLVLLAGCKTKSEESSAPPPPYPVTVNGVAIEESPKTVVSLSPALTEILFELGYGDRLVGRSEYCDYPDETKAIESVGSTAHPDLEKIISLAPKMVLTQSPMALKDLTELDKKGIAVFILAAPETVEGFSAVYNTLGTIFEGSVDGKAKGDAGYANIAAAIAGVGSVKAGSFVYITTPQLAVATGDTFESSVLSLFGTNIAASGTDYTFDAAQIAAAQPNYVFIAAPMTADALRADKTLSTLTAVQEGRVIVIDNRYFERPTARITLLLDTIKQAIQPTASTEAEATDNPATTTVAATTAK